MTVTATQRKRRKRRWSRRAALAKQKISKRAAMLAARTMGAMATR